jgi:hypothetical protein
MNFADSEREIMVSHTLVEDVFDGTWRQNRIQRIGLSMGSNPTPPALPIEKVSEVRPHSVAAHNVLIYGSENLETKILNALLIRHDYYVIQRYLQEMWTKSFFRGILR